MSNMSKGNRYWPVTAWGAATAVWLGVCLFLSWQTGMGTSSLSLALTRFLMKLLSVVGIRPEEAAFHAKLRLLAHFGVFFVAGALFCGTAEAARRSFGCGVWILMPSAALVTALALFADVPKLWIPGRHLTWSESVLNAFGALAGFLIMLFARWLIHKFSKSPERE